MVAGSARLLIMATTWGIHNNQTSVDPLADEAVRIGWDEMGDLSELGATRDAFKAAVAERMPQIDEASIPNQAGTVYRFVHAIKVGDIVVCPDRHTSTLNIGRVSGPYEFHPESDVHKQWRPVEWIRTAVARDELSYAAQEEISSATTLFKIVTGEDEIGHLLATPQPDTKPDYSWSDFYPRLADALMQFRGDRTALLDKLWAASTASQRPQLFKYLRGDRRVDGSRGPVRDIDLFTVLGSFNRGIRNDARALIAAAYGEEFGVAPPHPTSFAGVPVLNNLNSWFFVWEKDRGQHDIDALWDLGRAAVDYAADANEATRERLVATFDACPGVGARKLSIAIYWIRPGSFASYDSTSTAFLKKHYPDIAARLSLDAKLDGEQFLANTEILAAWIADSTSPFISFPEFSHAAWNALSTPEPGPGPDDLSDTEADVLGGESYDLESIRDQGCFIPEAELEPMLERLRSKKNIILQGPPGTGKTWLGRRLGWALCNQKNSKRVHVLQFHPSLTYEDFVRGWRPTSSTGLDLADGPFLDMCTQASADPDNDYVLVIEEINRGNPAQIFGELLTLLEAGKRTPSEGLELCYPDADGKRRPVHIPENLFVIGTMNIADRSLALVDLALRRRFAFVDLEPRLGATWRDWVVKECAVDATLVADIERRIGALNDQIAADARLGKQFRIGHSYVTPAYPLEAGETRKWFQQVVETEIGPLLEEYWFDAPGEAEKACERLTQGW